MTDVWDVLGSLAGAGGTLTAAFAIWQGGSQAKAQSLREESNSARQEIRAYKASIDRLLPSLQQGETLLSVSENIAQSFYQHFKITNVAELNTAMDTINGRISLLVRWIEGDPAAISYKAERMTLQVADSYLGARLPIFSEITNLLNALTNDGMSAVFFANFFKPEMRAMILRDLSPSAQGMEIEGLLAHEISSNAAMYFASRYARAIGVLDNLVAQLAQAHLGLQDNELHALATKAKALPASESRTGAMRNYLKIATPFFGKTATAKLKELVDQLETAISKEAAGEEAARLQERGN